MGAATLGRRARDERAALDPRRHRQAVEGSRHFGGDEARVPGVGQTLSCPAPGSRLSRRPSRRLGRIQVPVLAVAIAAAAIAPAQAEGAGSAQECDGRQWTVKEFRSYAARVYRRRTVSMKARRRMVRMTRCTVSASRRRARRMVRWRARYRRERAARLRAERRAAALTPFGQWAIPWPIVQCESGGVNRPPNSAGASGYYQDMPSTWRAFGGSTTHAYQAAKLEQDRVNARIWAGGRGIGHWSASRHCWGGRL